MITEELTRFLSKEKTQYRCILVASSNWAGWYIIQLDVKNKSICFRALNSELNGNVTLCML